MKLDFSRAQLQLKADFSNLVQLEVDFSKSSVGQVQLEADFSRIVQLKVDFSSAKSN